MAYIQNQKARRNKSAADQISHEKGDLFGDAVTHHVPKLHAAG